MAYQIMLSQAQVELITKLLQENQGAIVMAKMALPSTEHEHHNLECLLNCFERILNEPMPGDQNILHGFCL